MSLALETLCAELSVLNHTGIKSLDALLHESSLALLDLKNLEADLERQMASETQSEESITDVISQDKCGASSAADFAASLDRRTGTWHRVSLGALKQYNSQVQRFQRLLAGSNGSYVDLDDAYTFPLDLDAFPARRTTSNVRKYSDYQRPFEAETNEIVLPSSQTNHTQLMRSIILHLLKTGHGSLVADMLDDFSVGVDLAPGVLDQFTALENIVSDIQERHDITRALAWLQLQTANGVSGHEAALFKFHMLQFVLLLSGSAEHPSEGQPETGPEIGLAFAAYSYAKTHFPVYFKDHVDDLSPIFSLLLFKSASEQDSQRHVAVLRQKMHLAFVQGCEAKNRRSRASKFVAEMLENFDTIHSNGPFFARLAHDFVQEFCKGQSLLTELALFQAVLAGFVNLPNFYKYSQLQQKMRRRPAAGPRDLPFSLATETLFLFRFHPVFICPVSKEQLVPLVLVVRVADVDTHDRKRKQIFVLPNEVLVSSTNPVVVFGHCRHLALKESVRQLTKGGAETFKCHYCYKKHKLSEVSDAYFIDF